MACSGLLASGRKQRKSRVTARSEILSYAKESADSVVAGELGVCATCLEGLNVSCRPGTGTG